MTTQKFCPICEKTSERFLPYGKTMREGARCPSCGSVERHRFLWMFLNSRREFFEYPIRAVGGMMQVLHIAPERCFINIFKKMFGTGYLTADLDADKAMVQMDICNIRYQDEWFDLIVCNHVLEHVDDDRMAIGEFYRILKHGGCAVLNVPPIHREKTIENPLIVDPKERARLFGQDDHVRNYGKDYVDRLKESGFTVTVVKVSDLVDMEEADRMALTNQSGEIHFCEKT